MVKLEIKKNIVSIYFLISVLLLYLIFMLGDSGHIFPDDKLTTTIIGAIWNKYHGNWKMGFDSSYLTRMYSMWTDNRYLPVLMPVICGLSGTMHYLEEMNTTNKRLILARCSRKEYYLSKIAANLACAVSVVVMAIFLYYVTLFLLFDHIPLSDESFLTIYFAISGKEVEQTGDVAMSIIYINLFKGVLYFCLYAVMSSSFCYMMAVWCRDRYVAFGGMIFLCYMLCRVREELARKFVVDGISSAEPIADVLNPNFLHFAGRSGFYADKEILAVFLAVILPVFYYLVMFLISEHSLDVSER